MTTWKQLRIIIITGLILFMPYLGFSQGEFNKWYFGNKAGVDFNSGSPIALANSQMSVWRASVSVSDSLGNLLFYSDGQHVWNRNHQVMPNGSGLQGGMNVWDQTVNVVQKIEDDSSYYLFTMRSDFLDPISNGGLHYSVINMRLDGGLGDIEPGQKEIQLQTLNDFPSLMTTARHHNNRDAWVIVHNIKNASNYAAFLVTAAGITTPPVISQSLLTPAVFAYSNPGTMRISPDGNILVYPFQDTLEYCHFNAATGQITPLFLVLVDAVPFTSGWHYMEFSRDSRYLYCSNADWPYQASNIYQYDASFNDSTQFKNSEIIVGSQNRGCQLQMAPDGKIYGTVNGTDSLCVINNPSVAGTGCNFQRNAVSLQGNICDQGLPQFLQRYYNYIHHSGQCQWNPVWFNPVTWPPADSVHWNFGDPASGVANVSTQAASSHLYSNPGVYTVELYVRHNDHRTDTTWQTITIQPAPHPVLGPDQTICAPQTATFDAGACTGCTYQWDDLTNMTMNIGAGQTYTTGTAGLYSVNVTGPGGCTSKDTVQLFTGTPDVLSVGITTGGTTVCAGTPVTFSASGNPTGTSPSWQWKVNGVNTGTGGQVFTYTPANGDCITCVLTSNAACLAGNPATSNQICMAVDQPLPVSVTVTTPQTTVCAGKLVTYTANPSHGGSLPVYQWKLNTVNISGATSSTYTFVPLNGDVVTCQLTSSDNCLTGNPAISSPVTMTVNQNFAVTLSITASANPFCAGSQVTFTSNAGNAGGSPGYQWKVNAINVINATNASYAYNAVNGDVVTCEVTSSASCVTGNPAMSNAITMIVNTSLPAGVSISTPTNPFCPGTSVTVTATPTNGGSIPVYQWKVNATNVINATNASYAYNATTGDVVTCEMTSNLNCVTGNPVLSNSILLTEHTAPNVTFTSCFDTVTILGAQPFTLHGGLPLGGQYSGPGVNSTTGIFTPSVAGTGLKTITYGYSNIYTCLATKTKTILIQPNPAFTCGSNLTDIRDNKVYPTVQIGSQCWMASNLDFGFAISDILPQTDNCIAEKYRQNSSFYQWDELVRYSPSPGVQGLCPPGWHIPSAVEWNALPAIYSGPGMAGGYLKDSLLVNGFHSNQQGFLYLNNTWAFTPGTDAGAMYWTSTTSCADRAVARGLNNYNPSVSMYPSLRGNAFSVRCLRD